MAQLIGNGQVKTNDGKVQKAQYGAYYDGQAYNGSSLLAAGLDFNGKAVSNEVIAQTNPSNVAYIENLKATSIQPSTNLNLPSGQSSGGDAAGLQAQADSARKILDQTIADRKAEADAKVVELRAKEEDILKNKVEPLTTPFREDLETAERERLHINENFEANQSLTNELDTLLTQGNEIIKQQQSVTGLASIRNPRVQQTMSDINARVGVISAVMSARNNQISVAENMIDRSVDAITKDRNDQLSYYKTILDLNRQDMLSLDDTSKSLAGEQIKLLENDATRAADTVDYVKKLMINPDTALLMGQAGVTLNDSVDTINKKMAYVQYTNEVKDISNKMATEGYAIVSDPSKVPADQLTTITDSEGQKYYYKKIETAKTGGGGSGSASESAFLNDANTMSGKQTSAGYVGTFPLLVAKYAPYYTLSKIYQLYAASQTGKKYGAPKESAKEVQQIYDAYKGK